MIDTFTGKVWKYGDNINTDVIFPGKYTYQKMEPEEMAKHALEDLDPDFTSKVQDGDILVAGKNFGMGSSREQAPLVLIYSNTHAVIAKSFARIFYRNAINTGLPVVECDTDLIDDGDELDVDLRSGCVKNLTQGTEIPFAPLPPVMEQLLADGGLVEHFRKHGGFNLEE